MSVRMKRRYAGHFSGKRLPAVGEVFDGTEAQCAALVKFDFAEPVTAEVEVEAEAPAEPEHKPTETATADERETRDEQPTPAKRGPGRPRKNRDN